MEKTIRNLDADFAASVKNREADGAAYDRHTGDMYAMLREFVEAGSNAADAVQKKSRIYESRITQEQLRGAQRALATRDMEAYFGMGVPVHCDEGVYRDRVVPVEGAPRAEAPADPRAAAMAYLQTLPDDDIRAVAVELGDVVHQRATRRGTP